MTIWESGWHMASHFLYELKARLEHILKVNEGHLKDPEMFKNEIESIYRDLCIEVDPYGTPGDDDEPISDAEQERANHIAKSQDRGEL